jgi:hypothetical protein
MINSLEGATRSIGNLDFDAQNDRVIEATLSSDNLTFHTNVIFQKFVRKSFQEVAVAGNVTVSDVDTLLLKAASGHSSLKLPDPTLNDGRELKVKKTVSAASANLSYLSSGLLKSIDLGPGNKSYVQLFSDGVDWLTFHGSGYEESTISPSFWLTMNENGGVLTDQVHGLRAKTMQPGVTSVAHGAGHALDFNGSNSYLNFSAHTSLAPSSEGITFSFWFKSPSLTSNMTFFRWFDNSQGLLPPHYYRLQIDSTELKFSAGGRNGRDTSWANYHNGLAALGGDASTWHYMAISILGSSYHLRAYTLGNSDPLIDITKIFNGFDSNIVTASAVSPSGELRIAADWASSQSAMTMDDFRIYQKSLDAEQIQMIFDAGSM